MILVDTSVWVGHFKGVAKSRELRRLLEEQLVVTHPFVIGELVLGGLTTRHRGLLEALPGIRVASHQEVLDLVEAENLSGRGIGWVDAHLLASSRRAGVELWTADRSLSEVAVSLAVAWAGR